MFQVNNKAILSIIPYVYTGKTTLINKAFQWNSLTPCIVSFIVLFCILVKSIGDTDYYITILGVW